MKLHVFTIIATTLILIGCHNTEIERLQRRIQQKDSLIRALQSNPTKHPQAMNFDNFQPVVLTKNTDVHFGDSIDVDILLAAYNSQSAMEIYLLENGDSKKSSYKVKISNGIGHVKVLPPKKGEYLLHGVMTFGDDTDRRSIQFEKAFVVH